MTYFYTSPLAVATSRTGLVMGFPRSDYGLRVFLHGASLHREMSYSGSFLPLWDEKVGNVT